jgi:hypothetical protein
MNISFSRLLIRLSSSEAKLREAEQLEIIQQKFLTAMQSPKTSRQLEQISDFSISVIVARCAQYFHTRYYTRHAGCSLSLNTVLCLNCPSLGRGLHTSIRIE